MKKVGIFGGTFDPIHMGHIGSLINVAGQMELEEIIVIPAFQSPFRQPLEGPGPEARLEMVKIGLKDYSDFLTVDDREITRGGVSYTIETLESIQQEKPEVDMHLIIGMDQFENFNHWKNFSKILACGHLIVTSRPGVDLPTKLQEFPMGLVDEIEDFDGQEGLLKSGKGLFFVQLEDVDISSTEIRKRFRDKTSVHDLLPRSVSDYVKEHGLYEAVSSKIGDFEEFTKKCVSFLLSKKSINTQAFDLRDRDFPSEFTIVTSGTSTKQTSALAQNLMREIKTQYGIYPLHAEGLREGRWVVLDYGALIIHLFYDYVRMEYRLEELWEKGKSMDLEPLIPPKNSQNQ